MTLTQLKYILALHTHQHFAKAADKCGVTQPTLSMQIQKLEQELKIIIFDRTKHPVLPTQDGILLIEQARKVLQEAQKLNNVAINLREQLVGTLRIAILPSLAPYLLPLFVGKFARKYPNVQLHIMELHNYQLTGRLQQDRADVAITTSAVGVSGFYELPLFKEPIALYIASNHPLHSKQTISVCETPYNELILTEDTQDMCQSVLALCSLETARNIQANQQYSKIIYESGSVETIRKIIEHEGGITLLPQLAIFYIEEKNKHMVRYFEAPQPTRQVVLLTQRGFQKQRLIDALQQEILLNLPTELTT